MPLDSIPKPDDLVEDALKAIFGPAAIITIVFILGNLTVAWIGAWQTGAKVARATATTARQASARLSQMPRTAAAVASLTTATIVGVQGMWLWLSYVIGNGTSYLFTGNVPPSGPQWGTVLQSLHWDPIVETYVLASAVGIVAAYVLALKGKEPGWVVAALSLPAIFWGALTGFGSLLALLVASLHLISDHNFPLDDSSRSMMLMFGIAVTQIIACSLAMNSTETVVKVWRIQTSTNDPYTEY